MQKIISTIIFCFCMSYCFGQDEENRTASVSIQDYLKKSNNQRRMAGILFGIGSTAFIIASSSSLPSEYAIPFVLGGGAAVVASIPFFIASGRNKKKALYADGGIKLQQAPNPGFTTSKPVPALSISFHF